MRAKIRGVRLAVFALAALLAAPAVAGEVNILASNGVRGALEELAPVFSRATGHTINITFGLASSLTRDIERGAAFDLAILTGANIGELAKLGKIDPGSRAPVARSGVAIMVRAGAPKPDVSSPAALKSAVLAARAITWARDGQSGVYFASVLEKLGIGEQAKQKYKLALDGAAAAQKVASGEADFGALLVNEILMHKGVEVAGSLPAELQSFTVFQSGIAAGSPNADAAKAFAEFLATPEARAVFKAKGQEPG